MYLMCTINTARVVMALVLPKREEVRSVAHGSNRFWLGFHNYGKANDQQNDNPMNILL